MKERAELWAGPLDDVHALVQRQGGIEGLGLVDFNFPQHIHPDHHKPDEILRSLGEAGLAAGAVCLRYPKEFRAGALTNPNHEMQRKAVEMTKEAGEWAVALGAKHLIVWSAFCGYDYSLQCDYKRAWARLVESFREICDYLPGLKISLEFKPTDENTRFFIVPSTGAAVCLVEEVSRENMGICLDFGHCLMAGENPAQSVAFVGERGKLFALQLNDGYQRLGAEDGMMFGSVHPHMALELCVWLRRTKYNGHVYFDTFPRNEDPVKEAEYNIRSFKQFWKQAEALDGIGVNEERGVTSSSSLLEMQSHHDALAILEKLQKYTSD